MINFKILNFNKRGGLTPKEPSADSSFNVFMPPPQNIFNVIIFIDRFAIQIASLSFFILVSKVCEFNNFISQGEHYASLGKR